MSNNKQITEEEDETPFDTYHSALIEWGSGGLEDVPTYWLERFKQDLEEEINQRKTMTNNKQQTEINAVEYLDKVNQFAKENNTDKPRQQTAIEWLEEEMLKPNLSMKEILNQAKEMEKDQHIKSWETGLMKVDFNEYYNKTYGDDKQ
jgi:SMC interacting uncharacterized protein involved in chromosome segregation